MPFPLKFTVRPEIRDWTIFARGASASGFVFSYLEDEPDKEQSKTLTAIFKYSISLPLPEFLNKSIQSFEPFLLRSESIVFLFIKSPKTGYQVQVFSDEFNPKELTVVGEKVMRNLIQQYGYHRTLSLLRPRDYFVAGESVLSDTTVKMTLRRWTLTGKQVEDITVLAGPQKEEIQCEINPTGFLYFDLTQLEEENQERYSKLFTSEIGVRVEHSTHSTKVTHSADKTNATTPISKREP
jgi:hypothetical protein